MKKIILSLIAIMATMSINAQQAVLIYQNGKVTAKYTNSSDNPVKVVFFEIPENSNGEATVSESAGIDGNKVKWVQLWKDGPKWAEFNVGAKSASEIGGHYNWGMSEIQTSSNYQTFSTYIKDIQGTEYDTAKNLWGDNWMMPKSSDFDKLIANCDLTYACINKLNGILIRGRGDYAANTLFFPYGDNSREGSFDKAPQLGYYWSSTPDNSGDTADEALCLSLYDFYSDDDYLVVSHAVSSSLRTYGCSVRAILKE